MLFRWQVSGCQFDVNPIPPTTFPQVIFPKLLPGVILSHPKQMRDSNHTHLLTNLLSQLVGNANLV